MFRSFEANSGTIQRKGSEDLAKSSISAIDQSNLGQAPELTRTFVIQLRFLGKEHPCTMKLHLRMLDESVRRLSNVFL